jgi:hypothetical protein
MNQFVSMSQSHYQTKNAAACSNECIRAIMRRKPRRPVPLRTPSPRTSEPQRRVGVDETPPRPATPLLPLRQSPRSRRRPTRRRPATPPPLRRHPVEPTASEARVPATSGRRRHGGPLAGRSRKGLCAGGAIAGRPTTSEACVPTISGTLPAPARAESRHHGAILNDSSSPWRGLSHAAAWGRRGATAHAVRRQSALLFAQRRVQRDARLQTTLASQLRLRDRMVD